MQSALKSNAWQRLRFFENFKIEIKKEGGAAWGGGGDGGNNSDFLQNWPPQ